MLEQSLVEMPTIIKRRGKKIMLMSSRKIWYWCGSAI